MVSKRNSPHSGWCGWMRCTCCLRSATCTPCGATSHPSIQRWVAQQKLLPATANHSPPSRPPGCTTTITALRRSGSAPQRRRISNWGSRLRPAGDSGSFLPDACCRSGGAGVETSRRNERPAPTVQPSEQNQAYCFQPSGDQLLCLEGRPGDR